MLLRQLCSCTASHARPAIEHYLFVGLRLLEAKAVLKLFFGQEQGVGLRLDWYVDRARDVAIFEF